MQQNEKPYIADQSISTIAWLKIFFLPVLLGAVVCAGTWFFSANSTVELCGIMFLIVMIVAGIYLAENARKKLGAEAYLTSLNHSTDWDNLTRDVSEKEDENK